MENASEEIFEARDTPSGFLVECKIATIRSSLQRDGDTCENASYAFCNGQWTLKLRRRRHNLDVQLNRGVKASSHKSTVKFKIYIMGSDEEMVADHTVRKSSNNVTVLVEDLFRSGEKTGINAKIICLLQCFECNFETPEAPPTYSGGPGRGLLDLLIRGEYTDATIKVKERMLKIHKNIRDRSAAVFSMLNHDVSEIENGTVGLRHYERETFHGFLEYIPHAGELQDSSKDIVCKLYCIADKYQDSELKLKCVGFMSRNLSLENFFDVAALSVCYNEMELIESVHNFFVEHDVAILESDQFRSFVRQSTDVAVYFIRKLTASYQRT